MATKKEIDKYCRDKKLYDKAKVSVCATSDFSITVDGNLEVLEANAKKDGLEFFILKGELKKPSKKDTE